MYLWKRGDIYWFRRAIPLDLKARAGSNDAAVSLRTGDRGQARKHAMRLAVAMSCCRFSGRPNLVFGYFRRFRPGWLAGKLQLIGDDDDGDVPLSSDAVNPAHRAGNCRGWADLVGPVTPLVSREISSGIP